jgi:hypothetical protein
MTETLNPLDVGATSREDIVEWHLAQAVLSAKL